MCLASGMWPAAFCWWSLSWLILEGGLRCCDGTTAVMGLQRTAGFPFEVPAICGGQAFVHDDARRFPRPQSIRRDPLRETGVIGDVWDSNLTLLHAAQWVINAWITLFIIQGNTRGKRSLFPPVWPGSWCSGSHLRSFRHQGNFPCAPRRDRLWIQAHSSRAVRKSSPSEHTRLRPQTVNPLFIRIKSNVQTRRHPPERRLWPIFRSVNEPHVLKSHDFKTKPLNIVFF